MRCEGGAFEVSMRRVEYITTTAPPLTLSPLTGAIDRHVQSTFLDLAVLNNTQWIWSGVPTEIRTAEYVWVSQLN
jgi:hypothetical protein